MIGLSGVAFRGYAHTIAGQHPDKTEAVVHTDASQLEHDSGFSGRIAGTRDPGELTGESTKHDTALTRAGFPCHPPQSPMVGYRMFCRPNAHPLPCLRGVCFLKRSHTGATWE